MLFPLLYLLLPTLVYCVPHYYIVARVREAEGASLLSGQFTQELPRNGSGSTSWDCNSGLTPIQYPSEDGRVVRAQSIDVPIGGSVECLGLSVQVVMATPLFTWSDDVTQCPGHVTTTTELVRRDTTSRETFRLAPSRPFQVYTARPSETCARRESVPVESPVLRFGYHGNKGKTTQRPVSCGVSSSVRLWCNMTVTTRSGEVVAVSHGNTNISIPSFVWRVGGGGSNESSTVTVTCTCTCRLSLGSGPSRSAHLSHTTAREGAQEEEEGASPTESVTMVTPPPTTPLAKLYVALGVTAGVAMVLGVLSLSLCCHARRLRRRGACYRGRPLPAIPPTMTECGHYNTVSLRLTDEVGGCTQTFPIYHKLALSQTL